MKRIFGLLLTITLTAVGLFGMNGCKKEAGTNPAAVESSSFKSAEPNSFKEVTAKLDGGGDLFLYLSTEQWLKHLSDNVGKWRDAVASVPDLGENQKAQQAVTNGFNVVTQLIKDSGLENISGIGMSSIAREPGIYYSKMIVHHYSGQGDGFMWTMFGKQPHELDGLDLLPVDTAFAAFNDVDIAELWSVIQKECEASGFPQATEALKSFPAEFEKGTGMKWDDVLESLGGEYGVVMTLDNSKTMTVPLPSQVPLEIPQPALMLVVKVKNDAIFNRIDQELKKNQKIPVTSVDKGGLKMRTVANPIPGVPLSPTVATSQGYLFLATSDAIVQEALAVKGGKAGLKSTDEFKKLMTGVPQQGNQFCFLGKRFGETMMNLQLNAMENNNGMPPQLKELVQSLAQPDKAGFAFAVGANSDEGWEYVGNGNQSGGKVLAAATVVPAAVFAGVALPAIAKAKARAQKNAAAHTQSAQ